MDTFIKLLTVSFLCLGCSNLLIAEEIDHVLAIKGLRYADAKAGQELFNLHCVACHGREGKLAIHPLARKFAADEFKYGSDPYSIWKTISYGNGFMFRWDAVLSAWERYQLTHYINELIIKKYNPGQLVELDEKYFSGLPERAAADAKAQEANKQKVQVAVGMVDGTQAKSMDYGPFMQHSVCYGEIKNKNAEYFEDTTEKAMIVDVPGDLVFAYDASLVSVSGIWKGKIANAENTNYMSYKGGRPLIPGGVVLYNNVDAPCWAVDTPDNQKKENIKYLGHYLHGDLVVLKYKVGDREILETPVASDDGKVFYRSLMVGSGKMTLYLQFSDKHHGAARLFGGMKVELHNKGTLVRIPPSRSSQILSVPVGDLNRPIGNEDDFVIPDFDKLTKGGPRRWPSEIQTVVEPGENINGYALDILTVPLANPWGCWMRTTAIDFFDDGRMAVSTLNGDVWIVAPEKDNPNAMSWSRFASGMYEPLGLKVVKGEVYVRGRDRITKLHDLNKDGEADFYESFYEDPAQIGPSYHAFVYDLQTDKNGYFYYSQSGYKSPLEGAVVKLSSDGKNASFVGTDLRNPNGMGAIPSKRWITIADNPSGKAVYNGFTLAREGAFYGYEKNRTQPMLVVLPAKEDSSSGGQCESDADWGPLGGSVIHTSYSRCAAFYCFLQDVKPFPNGFAVKFPFEMRSGLMRPRVNPVDSQVYIVAQKGWDTKGQIDGVIYRIRRTEDPAACLVNAKATTTGIELLFGVDLDKDSISLKNFKGEKIPDKMKDVVVTPVKITKVELLNPCTVLLEIEDIEKETLDYRTNENDGSYRINPAISLSYTLKAKSGTTIEQTVHATINSLP